MRLASLLAALFASGIALGLRLPFGKEAPPPAAATPGSTWESAAPPEERASPEIESLKREVEAAEARARLATPTAAALQEQGSRCLASRDFEGAVAALEQLFLLGEPARPAAARLLAAFEAVEDEAYEREPLLHKLVDRMMPLLEWCLRRRQDCPAAARGFCARAVNVNPVTFESSPLPMEILRGETDGFVAGMILSIWFAPPALPADWHTIVADLARRIPGDERVAERATQIIASWPREESIPLLRELGGSPEAALRLEASIQLVLVDPPRPGRLLEGISRWMSEYEFVLRRGDLVVTVAGEAVDSQEAWDRVKGRVNAGEADVPAEVVREGRMTTLTIHSWEMDGFMYGRMVGGGDDK